MNTTKPYRRGVQIVRPFSHKEDALISQLRIDGHGTVVIAEAVFMECGVLRSQATINMRLKTLARREEEDEDLRARTAEHARRFPSTLVDIACAGMSQRPYGEWCRKPEACAGKGYCPLDPTCGD